MNLNLTSAFHKPRYWEIMTRNSNTNSLSRSLKGSGLQLPFASNSETFWPLVNKTLQEGTNYLKHEPKKCKWIKIMKYASLTITNTHCRT